MNIFSIVSLFSSFNYFYLGIKAIRMDSKSPANRVMMILSSSFGIWALGYTFIYTADNAELASLLLKLSAPGWGLFPAFSLHFLLILSRYKVGIPKPLLYIIIYLPALLIAAAMVMYGITPEVLQKVPYGWVHVFNFNSIPVICFAVYYLTYIIIGCLLDVIQIRYATFKREKKQLTMVVSTTIIALIAASVVDGLLPAIGYPVMPMISPMFALVWVFGIWNAINRYRFMALTTAIASDEIIRQMGDLLILTDHTGKVIQVSPQTLVMLGYDIEEIIGIHINSIVEDPQKVNDLIKIQRNEGPKSHTLEVNYKTKAGEHIPVRLSSSSIRDREYEIIGIVFVGHDLRDARQLEEMNSQLMKTNKKLQDMYNMSERDMRMAGYIQTQMFPINPPSSKEWDIAFLSKPYSAVSGDFYDFYEQDGRFLGLGLFDVSGHGVSSGLITLLAKTIIYRNFINSQSLSLKKVMELINTELTTEIKNIDNYISGILLRFEGNTVQYINAGHTELLFKKGRTGTVEIVNMKDRDMKGFFLGIENIPSIFTPIRFTAEPGDQLLLYTDCLNESTNDSKEEYGIERIIESFRRSSDDSSEIILNQIIKDFYSFIGDKRLNDDLTVILIKKR